MSYAISEKVMFSGFIIMFCLIAILATATVILAGYWANAKRAERNAYLTERNRKSEEKQDRERNEWMLLLRAKDSKIDELMKQIISLTQSLDRTKTLLEASEELRSRA